MRSILGLGIIDIDNLKSVWKNSRGKIVSRGASLALMPFIEMLIKDVLTNVGFFRD